MLILVTGATGRIGSNLIPKLLDKRHGVRALVLPEDEGKKRIKELGVECVEGRLEDNSIFPSILKAVEAVIHLGALTTLCQNNEQIFQTNIRGTYNILEAIASNNISLKRFIFASSEAVYPSTKPKYLPLDENHPRCPNSLYDLSKVIGEDMCQLYFRKNGIPVTCPRFSCTIEAKEFLDSSSRVTGDFFYIKGKLESLKRVCNPSNEINNQIAIFEDLYKKNGDILYLACDEKGKPYEMNICDVRDLVQALLILLENEKAIGEVFNVGSPYSFTFDRVVEYLSEKRGLPWVKVNIVGSFPIRYRTNITKARTYLGYNPQWDIFKMIDDALEMSK